MTRNRTAGGLHERLGGPRHRHALLTTLTVSALVAATTLTAPAATATPVHSVPRSAPAASFPVRPMAAAGHLAGRGCTADATVIPATAACDLYAMTGSTTLVGTAVPIWGFSSTGLAGSATAPGPVLVVSQGSQVSITVHNGLPVGQDLSLALPGQAAVAVSGIAGDDRLGVVPGGTRVYSFTADRPGTFLYEAGHTANGARQVAMGLAGALVVLPADGSAYGAAPAGYPATAYDDDAVLVISEIDPLLNANPNTFDMRNFWPKYRMFNGKPYPASDPVSTDQGHTVLLRYVNVGSQTHAMSVLGGDQVEIAQDGHQMRYPSTVTAESVEPGQTLDTLVKMPSGPEARLAVYEPAMHLDNNGQHTADPLQLAFGGLMTFLDTAAPPPSTDGVGPVSSHITVSPNPSDGLGPVTVTADVSDSTTGGSTVSQAEFVIDDAVTTGVGFGTPMTGIPTAPEAPKVAVTGLTGTISTAVLAALDAGKHTVFVRALDSAGNWGVVGSVILNLPKTGPQTTNGSLDSSPANGKSDVSLSATGDDSNAGGNITGAEYFIDTVGENATGTRIIPNRVATVVSEDATIPAATVLALGEGLHHVLIHSWNSLGLWGPTLDIPLIVDTTGPAVDAASVGPNPTNGILSSKSNPGYLYVSAQITDKDAGGLVQSNLVGAEAFLDSATKPVGTGIQLIAVDGSLNSTTEAVYGLIPMSQVKSLTSGLHNVYVRGQDAAGNWGALFPVSLLVDKVAPKLGALTGSQDQTGRVTLTAPVVEVNQLQAAEYWVGTTDPGVGKGTRAATVAIVSGAAVATIPLAGLPTGSLRFNLRVQDTAGNWSNAVSNTVTVRPNSIFSGLFEGTTPGWTSRVGNATTSGAARMPSPIESGSTKGLAVTVPSTATGRVSYVSDTTPTAETSYHAKFAFNRNTLTSGTNANNILTIFEGKPGANGQVFAVQFRMSGTQPQLRTLFAQSGGSVLIGVWVNLAPGPHLLQVDWVAGPATGATAGSLALTVDGTAISTQTGDNSTLRIETVLLGVTAGVSTGAGSPTGTAWFDSFFSTRFTL